MKITYWSDYACPYCYIGEARLHKAIAELGMEDQVELDPKAFELDPSASTQVESDTPTRFARKYGLPLEQAKMQVEHISELGREIGLDFRYATTQYTNTFDAHRLMKMALATGDRDLARRVNELLFIAYFTENKKLADREVLIEVGTKAGLSREEIEKMLDSNEFVSAVRADESAAAARGVRGVPYFVFESGVVIPGATAVENFKDALRSGWASSGTQCGPDGCKLP